MSALRDELFDVVDRHRGTPGVVPEVLLLAATTCLSANMTPVAAGKLFTKILARVYITLSEREER